MFILNHTPSIANQFLTELRDIHRQKDRMRFRKNLERLGEILAYELSKSLDYQTVEIETPLTTTTINNISEPPVILSVMRAALPFYLGVLNYFDHADSGFIGAYRQKHTEANEEVEIDLNYMACPSIDGKEIVIVDPMLATGKSFVKSVHHLLKNGKPRMVHIMAVIAAPEGLAYIKDNLNIPHKFWIGAMDDNLNEMAYIVPGLGDAGDLAFGPKL
ncbi:uracil phosphoribosyltransferase [Anditalea andensis]|uniref:Uracil phosphoribosyltransferase n=1 Tax=Anditalea andensis TaxID=1048983 RepID=A0A074LGF8_9BACT|nr:uracil phosphoribosyltransferase [Anditalea andensis]KEO72877.1 uracil phosphoribosyltransferase [Anditalea andensis]